VHFIPLLLAIFLLEIPLNLMPTEIEQVGELNLVNNGKGAGGLQIDFFTALSGAAASTVTF
jgi:hypothetical protein